MTLQIGKIYAPDNPFLAKVKVVDIQKGYVQYIFVDLADTRYSMSERAFKGQYVKEVEK